MFKFVHCLTVLGNFLALRRAFELIDCGGMLLACSGLSGGELAEAV